MRAALTAAEFWDELETTWACLDCELMPWSAKAQELLRTQYAAVGAAGSASLPRAVAALEQAAGRLEGEEQAKLAEVEAAFRRREQDIDRFVAAYRQYCWPVESLDDLKLAPFHLLATEGQVHTDQDHVWHMETLAEVCRADPELLLATRLQGRGRDRPGQPGRQGSPGGTELTGRGGEGMVVKPLIVRPPGRRGLVAARREVPGPGVPADHLRPRVHAPTRTWSACGAEAWAASGRWPCASSPSASRRWSGSCAASRCGGSTSASSACWPWRASRSTRGSEPDRSDQWT